MRWGPLRAPQDQLRALAGARWNYDPERWDEAGTDGWNLDRYEVDLEPEPPGAPRPGGPFEVACQVLRSYEFADPAIVTGVFDPESPLDGRTMLLDGRFLVLHFALGVRVGGVVDDEVDGVRRFGFHYRTLEGHLEQGQMRYEVRKHLAGGEVRFAVDAHSRAARIPNPVVRLGFKVFGRHVQRAFARRALKRMQLLVRARTAGEPRPAAVPAAAVVPGDVARAVEAAPQGVGEDVGG